MGCTQSKDAEETTAARRSRDLQRALEQVSVVFQACTPLPPPPPVCFLRIAARQGPSSGDGSHIFFVIGLGLMFHFLPLLIHAFQSASPVTTRRHAVQSHGGRNSCPLCPQGNWWCLLLQLFAAAAAAAVPTAHPKKQRGQPLSHQTVTRIIWYDVDRFRVNSDRDYPDDKPNFEALCPHTGRNRKRNRQLLYFRPCPISPPLAKPVPFGPSVSANLLFSPRCLRRGDVVLSIAWSRGFPSLKKLEKFSITSDLSDG